MLLPFIGCESNPDDELVPLRPKLTDVSYSGGDGSSVDTAVIIKAPSKMMGIRAEYDWMKNNRPNWRLEKQTVLKGGGKIFDNFYCVTPDGQRTNVFFDVTDFYGKK